MPPDQGQPFAQFIEFDVQFLHRSGSSVVLFDMVSLRGPSYPARVWRNVLHIPPFTLHDQGSGGRHGQERLFLPRPLPDPPPLGEGTARLSAAGGTGRQNLWAPTGVMALGYAGLPSPPPPGNENGALWPGIHFMVPQVVRGCARGYGVTSCAFFHARRLMKIEHPIRYAELAVGLMEIEHVIRYPALAVGLMVFKKLIWYTRLAVGLKPSAIGCEGRLRGL